MRTSFTAPEGYGEVIHRIEFPYKGMAVVQLIITWGPDLNKAMWVRGHEDLLVVNGGMPNPFVHADYRGDKNDARGGNDWRGFAIQRVREAFDEHWNLPRIAEDDLDADDLGGDPIGDDIYSARAFREFFGGCWQNSLPQLPPSKEAVRTGT